MQISLWPHLSHPPADVLAEARWADQTGWYGVWLADHYMPDTDTGLPADGPMHEVWGMLPAVAAVTERVRLGPLVSPTSVHHPAVLANRAATIDHLSAGRFVLGLGAGWQVNEHRAYGIDLGEPGPRVTRFEESIRIIASMLGGGRTTLHGTVYDVTDAPCDPPPLQSPLPLLVGTRGPRMQRITARHAQEWNAWGEPDVAIPRRAGLMEVCESVGRDPATLRTSANALIALDGRTYGDRPTLVGSVEQILDALGRYAEAGYDELILPDWNLGRSLAERMDALERLQAEIVGPFRATVTSS
jgi:alkanesulfonate monooxygenase SsuD/methylene tetrahydromethanopterin reductase-like flavin-dependent oxidoreductase (luciferase family)